MIDHKELMKQGQEMIAANLVECCREELEWQNTALLCNGKMREAGAIYARVDAAHALSIVQSEVARQAMQVVAAAPQVVADERAAIDCEKCKGNGATHYPDGEWEGKCGACLGTGWVSRDADIGTEQECFSCDGSGKSDNAAPVQAQEPRKPTDLSTRLRSYIDQNLTPYPSDVLAAADEIERYYGGMMNWKATAEAKDRAPVQPVAVPDGWTCTKEHDLGTVTDAQGNHIARSYYKEMKAVTDRHNASIAAPAAQGDACEGCEGNCKSCPHDTAAAQGDALMGGFDAWWRQCPEHNHTSENAARAAWASAAKAAS